METLNKRLKKIKEPVKLRLRKLSDGSASLYLDIYVKGIRRYEFLKLYLLPEVDDDVKAINKKTLVAANAIRAQRIVDITGKGLDEDPGERNQAITVSEWLESYKNIQEQKGIKGTNKIKSLIRLIQIYGNKGKRTLGRLDKEWALDFINWIKNDYIKNKGNLLGKGTVAFYVAQLSAAFNAAKRLNKMKENPFDRLTLSEKPSKSDSQRQFLSVAELKRLGKTSCRSDIVKRAFMFSCYTGLRISDIREIGYENIINSGNQKMLSLIMKKTGKPIYIPLSKMALYWLPNEQRETGKIFVSLPCLSTVNSIIKDWCKKADITKHITYHTSRHTFGTLMITAGVDLYVTSRLMGHSDVRITQIYARIIDSKKIEAVKRIDNLFKTPLRSI